MPSTVAQGRSAYELVEVPAGSFEMGHPSIPGAPVHSVTLSHDLWVGRTPVPARLYDNVMGLKSAGAPAQPAHGISWYEALRFANALSRAQGLNPCYLLEERSFGRKPRVSWPQGLECEGYRLPTEAEWEYFTRAGSRSTFWSGETEEALEGVGWHKRNTQEARLPEVGLLRPNPFGLYDVHGLVYEWCWDYGGSTYSTDPTTDPIGAPVGTSHIRRGGWWGGEPALGASARRDRYPTGEHFEGNGIRLVRTRQVPSP